MFFPQAHVQLDAGVLTIETAGLLATFQKARCSSTAYESEDTEDFWLDRVAICGRLDRKWFAATMIVGGDGNASGCWSRNW